jgi:hypothetical protein
VLIYIYTQTHTYIHIYNTFKKFTDKIVWPACLSACILRSLFRFPSRYWATLNKIFRSLYSIPTNKFLNNTWIKPWSVPFKCSSTHHLSVSETFHAVMYWHVFGFLKDSSLVAVITNIVWRFRL